MLPARLDDFKGWFKAYVQTFAGTEGSLSRALECKLLHTWDVCEAAVAIASSEGLPLEDRILAEAAGLFHDVARFEQYRDYKTFSDRKSIDHGEAGARLLLRERLLDGIDDGDRDTLLKAVSLHNKPLLPAGLPARDALFAKIVRDADKAAILDFSIKYFFDTTGYWKDPAIQLETPDTPGFSRSIAEAAISGRLILHSEMKNVNDFKISMFAWASDFNFASSAKMILRKGSYGKLASTLPEDHLTERLLSATLERLQSLSGSIAAAQ